MTARTTRCLWLAIVGVSVVLHGASVFANDPQVKPESEPAKTESAKTEPAKTEPAKTTEPAKPEASRPDPAKDANARDAMCLMIESAAKAEGLPLDFFTRVIWQESRFQPDAVGPATRNGEHAEGIAQFMPGTASERRLLDPFDPVQALPKSAEFLAELRREFGNLGLAAAAYNAGPRRVREWIEGTGSMPAQTRAYVFAITGVPVDDWKNAGDAERKSRDPPVSGCHDLMALLERAPNPFVAGLAQHVKLGANRPWGVQLAAGFSRNRALATYARAMKRLRPVIGDREPMLLGSIWRSRGTRTFYQVRIGTDTRAAANELCSHIRHAGQACLVLRNRGVRG